MIGETQRRRERLDGAGRGGSDRRRERLRGEEERKDRDEAEAGEERKDTIMCFVITSVERGCTAIPFYLSALILPKYLMPGVKGVGLEPMMLSPSTSDNVRRSYTKEQVESIKTEMELIKAFLKDVEAIMEPDSGLKFWEKEMRDIAHEAKAIIGTHENTRDASILKNMKAENKERLLTLNEPGCCVILIVGMAGSEPTAKDILQDIWEKVEGPQVLKGKRSIKDELKQMLWNFLREKRYLIVLDNIHMAGVWDDLKDAFPHESNGSRTYEIPTQRMMSAANAMGVVVKAANCSKVTCRILGWTSREKFVVYGSITNRSVVVRLEIFLVFATASSGAPMAYVVEGVSLFGAIPRLSIIAASGFIIPASHITSDPLSIAGFPVIEVCSIVDSAVDHGAQAEGTSASAATTSAGGEHLDNIAISWKEFYFHGLSRFMGNSISVDLDARVIPYTRQKMMLMWGSFGKIVVASLPPRSIARTGSSVGASAISDEIVDFFREFDKRRLNPHPEWHFWKFNGPFVSFGDFWVPSDSVPYLRQLTTRHGNFVAKFKLGAGFGGPMLSLLGSVLAAMDKSDLGSVTKMAQHFFGKKISNEIQVLQHQIALLQDSLAVLTTYHEEMVSTGVIVLEFERSKSLFDNLIR
uniref:NB-ARC domain-containing protein n=1 Tax=Fagus sylvatica TaxID=28930 RepID=A0A2N9GLR9_FAGSY